MNKTIKLHQKDFIILIEEAFKNNQRVQFKVMGHSMRPFFKHDKTHVTLEKKDTYQKGDIILFQYKDSYHLHRIIKVGEVIICQGDALKSYEIIQEKDIIGAVISYWDKKVRYVHSWTYQLKVSLWMFIKRMMVWR